MRDVLRVIPLIGCLVAGAGCGRQKPERAETPHKSIPLAATQATASTLSSEVLDEIVQPFNLGVGLMEQYRPGEAVQAFEAVARRAPEWIAGRLNLAIALLNSQSDEGYVRAEKELKWVIGKDPNNPYAHFALGMLFVHLGRSDEAKAQFEAVLRIDPDDADAHYQLGSLLVEDDPPAARRHMEKTLEKIPHHESACYRLATLLRTAGEPQLAQEYLVRFQALKSSGSGVFAGMKYGEMGRYAEVIRVFEAPRSSPPNRGVPAYTNVAESVGLVASSAGKPGWPGEGDWSQASTFGPALAIADLDGSGSRLVYITGTGPQGDGALFRYQAGHFTAISNSGIAGRNAIGACFADYDGDGDSDLYLTCVGPNRLYRNDGDGHFTDVTAATGTGGGAFVSVGAAWADADHDGDLDLYVANYASIAGGTVQSGAPNFLFRNNGDGTFTEVARDAGIDGGNAATVGVLFFDFDDDRDLDILLINQGSPNRLFLNDRVGRYTEATSRFPELADDGSTVGVLVGDVDRDGRQDVLLLRGPKPPRLLLQRERGRFVEDKTFAANNPGGAASGILADLDLDGDLDLVLLSAGSQGKFGHKVLLNQGTGRFDPPVPLGQEHPAPDSRGALAVDLDGNGSLELLVTRAGASPELWQAPLPKDRHWLEVLPAKPDGGPKTRGLDALADGLVVEVKSGRQLQVGGITTSPGYLGAPPRQVHFGLGEHTKADYVRLSWADGVFQSELEIAADQRWQVPKVARKPSSCPVLFSWDGRRFAFVTDFLGVGGLGFFLAPGQYAPPDPTEDVRLPPELIAPRGNCYLLRIAEPLEEVSYIDQLHLVAYDHPQNCEVYPDERFASAAPFATGKPFGVVQKIFPKSARTDRLEDVLDRILKIDRRYVEPPVDPRFVGYAKDHWLELDFGDRLQKLNPTNGLVLYLYGWVEYTYSHVNYAAHQAGISLQAPRIEVPDGHGGWRVAIADAGFPAGLPRMMTLDISALSMRDHGRLRIRGNMEIFWDQIFAGENVPDGDLKKTVLRPSVAELRFLGYPREFSPDGAEPAIYDYHRIDQGVPFRMMSGRFTRFGDVRKLLERVDDQFVIMARGEEIALEFDAAALPALPNGWRRTLVLHADGYCKDMDLYTAFPDTVTPLPYHAMQNYPPAAPAPNQPALEAYERAWNTRQVIGN